MELELQGKDVVLKDGPNTAVILCNSLPFAESLFSVLQVKDEIAGITVERTPS